jgi:hypothetical protein
MGRGRHCIEEEPAVMPYYGFQLHEADRAKSAAELRQADYRRDMRAAAGARRRRNAAWLLRALLRHRAGPYRAAPRPESDPGAGGAGIAWPPPLTSFAHRDN